MKWLKFKTRLKWRVKRILHADRIRVMRWQIAASLPAALDGDGDAVNTITHLSLRLHREFGI